MYCLQGQEKQTVDQVWNVAQGSEEKGAVAIDTIEEANLRISCHIQQNDSWISLVFSD